jgi:hypothetical protein
MDPIQCFAGKPKKKTKTKTKTLEPTLDVEGEGKCPFKPTSSFFISTLHLNEEKNLHAHPDHS